MNSRYLNITLLLIATLGLGGMINSCGHNHSEESSEHHAHDGHDHEHEDHKHEDEDKDHEHEEGHEGHDHSDLIEMKAATANRFGVKTEKADPADFYDVIRVGGRIETKASDEGVATATRSGILTLFPSTNVGVNVKSGNAIGSISSSNVQGGDPSLQASAVRNAAKRELDRLKPLHDDGIVSTEEYNAALRNYEEAEAAVRLAKQGSVSVTSPKSGIITQLLAQTGEYVEVGTKIAVISGNTSLTLRADVPEKYITAIPMIESANFRPSSSDETYNLDDLDGKLLSNGTNSVSNNGYIPIFFTLRNNGSVAPGSYADVYLRSGKRKGVISVPKEAIVEISGTKCIYTEHEKDHYMKHVVTLGASDGQRVEILSGLESGEKVVVKGAQAVRMAETSATAVPGHTHNH